MIKLVNISIIFLLSYLGFTIISEYNTPLEINILEYKIQTTIFVFIALFLITQLFLSLFFRIIFMVRNIPTTICNYIKSNQIKKTENTLMASLARVLMGHKNTLPLKILNKIEKDNKNEVALIQSINSNNQEQRIEYLKLLSDKKIYSIYSCSELARIYYEKKLYKEAEQYGAKALNQDDTDTRLILLLIRIYSKLCLFNRMITLITKLKRSDIKLYESHSEEFSSLYFLIAKDFVKSDVNEAIQYLNKSIDLRISNDKIDLLIELYNEDKTTLLKTLKDIFISNPNFYVAKIYIDNSQESNIELFPIFKKLLNNDKHLELILAISAYLKIDTK